MSLDGRTALGALKVGRAALVAGLLVDLGLYDVDVLGRLKAGLELTPKPSETELEGLLG
jgi:hypothetical protein